MPESDQSAFLTKFSVWARYISIRKGRSVMA